MEIFHYGFNWRYVNFGLSTDKGLVPSGNKPLPQTMLTKIYTIQLTKN